MNRIAILVAATWSLALISASGLPFPKTIDEAIIRIADEERERVAALRERILETTAKLDGASMKDYVSKIPKTGAPYDMVAIRGGEFLMGSPPDEPKRHED